MKYHNYLWDPEDYYRWGLSKAQKERIQKENERLTK
jgi:hypothetical protein